MSPPIQLAVAACLLVMTSGAISVLGAGALAQEEGVNITDVTYTGQETIDVGAERLHLWQTGPHSFSVTVQSDQPVTAELCLNATASGYVWTLTCQEASLAPGTGAVSVSVDEWAGNLTGEQTVVVRLTDPDSDRDLARHEIGLTVLRKSGDRDGDGLTNQREVEVGSNLSVADTDSDGLDDRVEVEVYRTNPLEPDSDSDGLTDGEEVTTHQTDPGSTDTDGDGLADGTELNRHGTNPNKVDTDGDGLTDSAEVNTYQTDPTNADTDGDGLGDGAEVENLGTNPTGIDTDSDGLPDGEEQNVYLTDPTMADTDGDGLDDAAEVREYQTDPTASDTDGDSLNDHAELTTHGTNPNAVDTDSDGISDSAELRRGTDPTRPTAVPDGPVDILLGLITRRLVVGVVVVIGLGVGLGTLAYAVGVRPAGDPILEPIASRLGTSDGTTGMDLDDGGPPVDSMEATTTPTESAGMPSASPVLTNEERVQQLLESNGGRMLQSDMVEASDWSKATVSRVLSRMEDDGTVTRIDIGKGNLVTRPGDEPDKR